MKVRDSSHEPLVEDETTSPTRTLLIAAAVVALGVYAGFNIVLLIVSIIVVMFMHELGHYLTARWAGMKVTEFFIGFGPRIWSFQRGETEYGFKAIPAGAYVRIIGMSNLEDVDSAEEERTYRSKPYWRRLSVAVAGSTMHFLMALVLIFTVFTVFGVQRDTNWQVGLITEPSAALDAGLHSGDRIVGVDGRRFDAFDSMSTYIRANPGRTVTLTVIREGKERTLEATLGDVNPSGEKVGFLGIRPTYPYDRVDPLSAALDSVTESVSFGKQAIGGLAHILSPSGVTGYVDIITNPDADGVGGADISEDRPSSIIGVVQIGNQVAENGLVNVLTLLFGFNIFIGIFNLLPVLPFDGGHVAIATYEKIRSVISGRRYQADVAKLLPLTYVVVLALALLFVTTIYLDIAHPVSVN